MPNFDEEMDVESGGDILAIGNPSTSQYSDISNADDFDFPSFQQLPAPM